MKYKKIFKKFIPKFALNLYYFSWPFLGALFFGFPGKDNSFKIIGVTGTSGKSTTTDLITRILEEGGNRVASISTIRFKIAEKEWENKYKMSMPGRFVIQNFLKQAKKQNCNFVVLEVTSEGIRQFRHKFINFDTVVFTNLSPEHIESHGGFENYRNEKLKLFKDNKNIHVINRDDENAKYFYDLPSKKKISFSLENVKNIVVKETIRFEFEGQTFILKLAGRFNIYNALAAINVAKNYGINLLVCAKALEKAKAVSGRMEIVLDNPFKIIVDYAHTPAQLESVYKTFENEKLVCVLGSCGGGRDKWKRPILGELAKKYCKEVVITNEDPYDEKPEDIMDQVAEKAGENAQKIMDRKEAIIKAIKLANPGDVVIITGKGSEPWMCLKNGEKIPWDDRQIVKEFLNKKL